MSLVPTWAILNFSDTDVTGISMNLESAGVIPMGVAALMLPGLLLTLSGCAPQPSDNRASLDIFSRYLDTQVPVLLQRYDVPGASVALVREGRVVWSGAYGYADREQGRRMMVDALFRVESIAKPVTAWGIYRLVEQGRIELDSSVQRYLGEWQPPVSIYSWQGVTVRRLLSHNAGLPLGTIGPGMEYPPEGEIPSLRETLFREARLIREPGTGFSYSNTGFNLLQLLVEQVSGEDFSRYMSGQVLKPLRMHGAVFGWDEARRDRMPTGYDRHGTPVADYVYPVQGAGGLLATVEDIARFVSAEMTASSGVNGPVLSQDAVGKLHTPQVEIPGLFGIVADGYGLGHFIEELADGRRAVWHGGQGHGWMSHFHAVPQSGDGIVILTNSQRSWPFMAQLLSDWAEWSGIGPVKMGRILYGITALQLFIVTIVLISLGLAYRLARGLLTGRRRFAPLSRQQRGIRLTGFILGSVVIEALAWAAVQPYLMISSIFPATAGQAAWALVVVAMMVMVSVLFPRTDSRD